MTKLQAIAKMLFGIMGVYAFKEGLSMRPNPIVSGTANNAWLWSGLLSLFFYWVVAYFLIFKSDKLAVNLGKDGEEADNRWVVKLFITAAIFAGGLLLAGCIRWSYVLGDMFKAIAVLPTEISRYLSSNEMPTLINIDSRKKMLIITWLVKTAAALYLLFGMKRFIRWQISKLKSLNLAIEAD